MPQASTMIGGAREWRLRVADVMPMIEARRAVRRHVLANGLTVLLHPDPATTLVHISVAYRVGSMDEGPGQTGLAHFIEHLMFAGTRALPGSYMKRMLEAGAVEVNALTMRDLTRYFQTVPAHIVDLALFAEADRMVDFAGSLDPAIIERERKVVLEEKRQNEGRPLGKVPQWMAQGLLPVGHPYRHPTIGDAAEIERYTPDAIRDWHATHYAPGNAVVVVAGGFQGDAMFAAVERYFGPVPAGPVPARIVARVEPAPRQSVIRANDWTDVPGYHLQAWSTPSAVVAPRENLALSLAAELIGGGRASPMHRRLVDELGLASEVAMSLTPGRAAGLVAAHATLADPHVRLDGRIDAVIDAFVTKPIAADELERLRIRRIVNVARGLTSFEQMAALLAGGEVLHGNATWFHDEALLIAELEESEIRAAAQAWLGRESLTLVITRAASAVAGTRSPAPMPQLGDPAATPVNAPAWEEVRLTNGARVRVSRRPGDPTFQLRAIGASGKVAEPETLEGLAMLLASIPAFGAGPDDAAPFAERTARAGLSVGMRATPASVWLDVSGLRAALPSAAAIVGDVLLRPRYMTADYNRRLAAIVQEAAGADAPGPRAERMLHRMLVGDRHRLAAVAGASPALAEGLTIDIVARFHDRIWDPADTVLLLAGDIDPVEARELLETMTNGWTGSTAPSLVERLDTAPTTPGIRLVPSSGDSVELTVAWIAPIAKDADKAALACLVHLLAGHYGSRANDLLREERGWTYGVNGSLGDMVLGAGPMRVEIATAVMPEKVGDTLRAIEDMIAALRGGRPPSEAEIEAFRREERQRLARLNETAGQAVSAMHDALAREKMSAADWDADRAAVEALDPVTLAAAARRLLPAPGMLAGTMVGEPDRILASLAQAGAATPLSMESEER